MIKELYIDGYLVDIDDNFSIVRQYSSPFFSDVTQLKNNASYSTKIPETQNNSFIMDYLEREDADTTFPYRVHVANYYEDSFPIFENAEVRVIDAFELQFVWGLNRGKYLPLFEKKLNEIVPNGTTILATDWVVEWKKSNVIYETGKKFKYLNYISGERESEVKIINGVEQPLTDAPEPYLSNLKEMTMHPFILFNDILDLIIRENVSIVEKTMTNNPIQDTLTLNNITGLYVGMIIYVIVDFGANLYEDGIKITEINGLNVTFNVDVSFYYELNEKIYFADTNIKPFEFDDLKQRLTDKGLILGGNKGYKEIIYTRSYPSEINFDAQTYNGTAYYCLPLGVFISSFISNNYSDTFYWNIGVLCNEKDYIEISINLTTLSFYQRDLKLYSVTSDGSNEITEIMTFEFTYDLTPGGYTYKRIYNVSTKIKKEIGLDYFIGGAGNFSSDTFIKAGGEFTLNHTSNFSIYSMMADDPEFYESSNYNCLMNLPEITAADFINEMLKMTGLFIGHDVYGNMKFLSLDNFKANMLAGTIYDWSGKVSGKEKSYFQFNSNAQKNWIKFSNSDDRTYTAKDSIVVDDTTLDTEKDLYSIKFDLAEQAASGMAEFILYKQKVASSEKNGQEVKTFSNEYSSKNDVCVYDNNGIAKTSYVLPNSSVNPVLFSMVLTRTGNYTFTFVTPTSGLPVPEIGNRVYSPNPFGSGYVYKGLITNKDGNTLTVSFLTLSGTTITFWIDNSATGFVPLYYGVFKDIVYRPRVLDIVVKLDFLETLEIDFEKPVYISDYGKYAVLLDIKIPDDGLCNAKILLINQTL